MLLIETNRKLGFLTSIEFQDGSFGLEVVTVVVGYFKLKKVNCQSSIKLSI